MNKFNIITRVDLPVGAEIAINLTDFISIMDGRAGGEIIKEGGQYVLCTRGIVTGKGSELGPTGKYPDGKIWKGDIGELKLGIAIDAKHRLIVIAFGTDVCRIAFDADGAVELADVLINKAHELSELKGEGENETQRM